VGPVSYEPQLNRGHTFDKHESRMRASAREQLEALDVFRRRRRRSAQ
jgi:hypothetical protein